MKTPDGKMTYYRVKLPHYEGWKYFRTEEEALKYGSAEIIDFDDDVDRIKIDIIELILSHDEKKDPLERKWIRIYEDM